MPKLKTHKGTAKRIRVTGTGKLMRMKGLRSHLRRNKAKRVKAMFDEMIEVNRVDRERIRKLMPYGA
ncbi:MAG: 50S ribosomal protein L35 [Chloroflexota bacterium]